MKKLLIKIIVRCFLPALVQELHSIHGTTLDGWQIRAQSYADTGKPHQVVIDKAYR